MANDSVTVVEGVSIADLDMVSGAEVPFEFEVVSPKTEKPMGIFISVLGDDANKVQAFTRRELNRRRLLEAKSERRGNKQAEVVLIEEDVDFAIDSAVARTVAWRGITEPFSEANAKRLYKLNPRIRQQVLEASNNSANFSKV